MFYHEDFFVGGEEVGRGGDHYGTFGGEVTETLAGDLHAPNSDDE